MKRTSLMIEPPHFSPNAVNPKKEFLQDPFFHSDKKIHIRYSGVSSCPFYR